ncbi:hypothetical protein D920_02234 [Enterococcus faecalis 13-SD-W-01]|nr:hypothetical protein D920_02234 [Enterococcus faecalis 13-SD-W-01]
MKLEGVKESRILAVAGLFQKTYIKNQSFFENKCFYKETKEWMTL